MDPNKELEYHKTRINYPKALYYKSNNNQPISLNDVCSKKTNTLFKFICPLDKCNYCTNNKKRLSVHQNKHNTSQIFPSIDPIKKCFTPKFIITFMPNSYLITETTKK